MMTGEALRQAIIREVGKKGGRPASDVVEAVARGQHVSRQLVHRELRSLLERGEIDLASNLNLTLPTVQLRRAAG